MKKLLMSCALIGALAGLVGCSTVEYAKVTDFNGQNSVSGKKPIAQITTHCSGLYLLTIPLITGSTENIGFPTWGDDCANSPAQVRLLTKKADALNGDMVVNLTSSSSSQGLLFSIKTASASGTVVK